jgi:hypothetical protein
MDMEDELKVSVVLTRRGGYEGSVTGTLGGRSVWIMGTGIRRALREVALEDAELMAERLSRVAA